MQDDILRGPFVDEEAISRFGNCEPSEACLVSVELGLFFVLDPLEGQLDFERLPILMMDGL